MSGQWWNDDGGDGSPGTEAPGPERPGAAQVPSGAVDAPTIGVPAAPKRRPTALILAVFAAIAGIVAAVVVLQSGSDDTATGGSTTTTVANPTPVPPTVDLSETAESVDIICGGGFQGGWGAQSVGWTVFDADPAEYEFFAEGNDRIASTLTDHGILVGARDLPALFREMADTFRAGSIPHDGQRAFLLLRLEEIGAMACHSTVSQGYNGWGQ